jgi:transcription-repair coupling factor (superfamily II helicase)
MATEGGDGGGDDSPLPLPGLLHRPIAAALAEVESFTGFDLAELHESDRHPNDLDLASRPVPAHPNQFGRLAEQIKGHLRDKARPWIVSAQPSRAVALLEEHDCVTRFVPNARDFPAIERLVEQATPVALKLRGTAELEGFQLPAWKLVLFTDREIFGQHSLAAGGYVRRRRKAASRTVDPNKMLPGDFVVHRNHGIGRFLKLEKLAIGGEARDYLVVQYADGLLRVAADQLGSLGRYRASSDSPPELNRMGGTAWTKAKERARKAVAKVAMDLVKLYAERHQAPGFAFPPTAPGRANWRILSPTTPPPTSSRRSWTSSATWSGTNRWTGWCAAMWASARRRWRSGRSSRRSPRASSAPCWPPPPCWPSSTGAP